MVARSMQLARTENRVVRPRDFRDLYARPADEFARLTREGVLMRLAHGYYVLVPEEHRLGYWRPTLEGVALGVSVADHGRDGVALMGISGARLLGAIPRALATAVVATVRQRAALETTFGRVEFVKRDVERLDVQRVTTDITTGWVTTAGQTALDLADRPALGAVAFESIAEGIRALGARSDLDLVARLATEQRKRAAWQRLMQVLDDPARRGSTPA